MMGWTFTYFAYDLTLKFNKKRPISALDNHNSSKTYFETLSKNSIIENENDQVLLSETSEINFNRSNTVDKKPSMMHSREIDHKPNEHFA
jgi:hypothetical protein